MDSHDWMTSTLSNLKDRKENDQGQSQRNSYKCVDVIVRQGAFLGS